jgi:tetratricopeptide (TPR) repeat protein
LSSASFSPDGTQVVTASDDNTARVWDASSGAELAVMRGHSWAVKCPSFSPDGTRIVTSGITSARVWDASGGAELTRLDEPRGLEIRAVFSLDGSRVVTAASNGNVRVWDASSGVELVHLEGHTDDVNSAVFNPDGARIVTASDDNTARVWDASSGAELARLDGHTDRVFSADFSPDGARIITSSADGTARVWDSVPYRIRYAERKRLEAVAPEARALLDSAREHSHDWSVIADELRTDASLSPIMRQATLRELSRIANPIVLEARKLANELRARLLFAEDVVAHIEADESLAADLRHEALRVAKRFGNEPAELHAVAWDAVESPGADPDRLQRALRAARIAAEQSPDGGDIVTTLGVALYRTGDFAGALETLTRSNGLNEDDKPADVAFMAMTHFRLGHVQEANTELERLRGMVDNQSDDDDRRYLEEAEAALAAPSDDRR